MGGLNGYQEAVDRALTEICDSRIVNRIWQHDHTVWRPDPAEDCQPGWAGCIHCPKTCLLTWTGS